MPSKPPIPLGRTRPVAQAPLVVLVRHAVTFVTSLGVAGYTILICLQVVFRYGLNSSLTWSEEVVQFMLLWTVMLGSAMATDRGMHISLNPLEPHVGPAGRRLLARLAHLGTIVFCAYLAWYGWQLMSRTMRMTSPAADIPMWIVYAAMPVGAVLIIFFAVVHLIDATDPHLDPIDERV